MDFTLIGFKAFLDKDDSSVIKSYMLVFTRDSSLNTDGEYGNLAKIFYVFPNQILGVKLSVGKVYRVFSAYESSVKKELFAGMFEVQK